MGIYWQGIFFLSAVYVDMYMSTAVHYLFVSAFSVTLYENVFNVDKALTSAYHLLPPVDQKCVSSYIHAWYLFSVPASYCTQAFTWWGHIKLWILWGRRLEKNTTSFWERNWAVFGFLTFMNLFLELRKVVDGCIVSMCKICMLASNQDSQTDSLMELNDYTCWQKHNCSVTNIENRIIQSRTEDFSQTQSNNA